MDFWHPTGLGLWVPDPPMLLSLLLSARHQKLVEQLSSSCSTGAPPDR
jgi:hypothetical protein